jgi:hypothetical protein
MRQCPAEDGDPTGGNNSDLGTGHVPDSSAGPVRTAASFDALTDIVAAAVSGNKVAIEKQAASPRPAARAEQIYYTVQLFDRASLDRISPGSSPRSPFHDDLAHGALSWMC